MDRAEAGGFGVALAGHALLLGVLSMGFANAVKPPIMNQPMEVSFVEETGLESAAPVASQAELAARLAEVEGPVEPLPPPPAPAPVPEPLPQPKVIEPVPAPKPVERPRPKVVEPKLAPKPAERPKPQKPAPPKAKAIAQQAPSAKASAAKAAAGAQPSNAKSSAKPTGRLSGLLTGMSDREAKSQSTAPPAKVVSAAVKSSLGAEVRRQLKPHWKSPTGADSELLRTELSITLAPNGSVTNVSVVGTSGQTESNRPQVKLHQEQAVRAAKLASPFRLPAEFYDAWKVIRPTFDKRLSQ